MKTSVVLCTYNGEKYISEQLKSILNQSVKVDEIIISDDHSTDSTLILVSKFLEAQEKVQYKIVINKEKGISNNFSNALSHVNNDIIFFSDQDDIWLENKVEKVLEIFNVDDTVSLVCSNAFLINDKKELLGDLFSSIKFDKTQIQENMLLRVLQKPFVTGATMAITKSLYEKAYPFSKVMLHDQWLSYISALNKGIYVIDESLIYYRQHENNVIGADHNFIYKLFHKKSKKVSQYIYGEEMVQWYTCLKEYIQDNESYMDYLVLVNDFVTFWKKRVEFQNFSLKEVRKIIKESKKEYSKYSLTMNSIYEYLKYFDARLKK